MGKLFDFDLRSKEGKSPQQDATTPVAGGASGSSGTSFPQIAYDFSNTLIAHASDAVNKRVLDRDRAAAEVEGFHQNSAEAKLAGDGKLIHARRQEVIHETQAVVAATTKADTDLAQMSPGDYQDVPVPGRRWTGYALTQTCMWGGIYVAVVIWGFTVNKAFFSQQVAYLDDYWGACIAAAFALFLGIAPKILYGRIHDEVLKHRVFIGYGITAVIAAVFWYLAGGIQAGLDNAVAQNGLLGAASEGQSVGTTAVPILRFLAQGLLEMTLGALALILFFETWEKYGETAIERRWFDNPKYLALKEFIAQLATKRQALLGELEEIDQWLKGQGDEIKAHLAEVMSRFTSQLH